MKDLEYRIGKLQVAPGDVLVVKVDSLITLELAERLKETARQHLPDGVKALVVGRDVDLSVLTKTEIEARTEG